MPERLDFRIGQLPPRAGREFRVECERPHGQPLEPDHPAAHRGDHALDLMELALAQGDFHGGQPVVRRLLQHAQLGRAADRAVLQHDTRLELRGRVRPERARDMGQIELVHMPPGRGQCVAHRAVVGQQEQTLGVLVQPPDRKQSPPLGGGQEVEHGFLRGILGRGDDAARLVEHHIPLPPGAQRTAAQTDRIRVRVDLLRRVAAGHAVDRHQTAADHPGHFPPGARAPSGKHFIQPLARHLDLLRFIS